MRASGRPGGPQATVPALADVAAALASDVADRGRAVAAALRALAPTADASTDALVSILVERAIDLASHWRSTSDDLTRAAHALAETQDEAERAWARLAHVLAAAAEQAAAHAATGDPSAPRGRPRRRWFRRPSARRDPGPANDVLDRALRGEGRPRPDAEPSIEHPTRAGPPRHREPVPTAGVPPPAGPIAAGAPRSSGPGHSAAPRGQPTLTVQLLGSFRVERGGRAVDRWGGAKAERVARYLIARAPQRTRRDVLLELFWPEFSPETGRRSLHQAVYVARRALSDGPASPPAFVFDRDAYVVNPVLTLLRDVDAFEAAVRAARQCDDTGPLDDAIAAYALAEQSYAGDYLADEPYEEWALAERDRLRLVYLDVGNRLGALYEHRGSWDAALGAAHRVLTHDPCEEEAHRRAMRCHAAMGHRNLALRQYRSCVESLRRAYDLGPSPETIALERELVADGGGTPR